MTDDHSTGFDQHDALEHLLAESGLVSAESLSRRRSDWEAAYRRTPHGQVVELRVIR